MPVILHHLELSRSERIIWLLEELNAPYEIKRYKRDPQIRLAPPELAEKHKLGKAPLLELEDGAVIAETGAIAQYLLETFDPDHALHPAPGTPERLTFLEWMHASEGAVFLPFLMSTYCEATGLKDSLLDQFMDGERAKAFAHIEAHLKENDFFAGEQFSAADCLMGFQLDALAKRGGVKDGTAIKAWLDRVHQRDAYKAMRKVTDAD